MKKKKRGFTLVELMAVIAIAMIVLPIIFSVFKQGYKIINRTENKTNIQNDFRTVITNIENEITGVEVNNIIGYLDVGVTQVLNEASIQYDGQIYTGRYIVDIVTEKKVFLEVDVSGKKELWKSDYVNKSINSGIAYYELSNNKVLAKYLDNSTTIVARNNNGILTFNMDETNISSEYYGGVKTTENDDINMDVTNTGLGNSGGSRQPILFANSVDGIVSINSNNKEVFFDTKKLDNYYVVNSKIYNHEISNSAYGIHQNKGEGINIPIFNFEYKSSIVLETIDENLYFDKVNGSRVEKIKITDLGISDEIKVVGEGIRYFTVNDYKVYLVNANKLIINNSTTNNLKWNKLQLTDTIIICTGNIEINNSEYCSTNLSGSMIAGKNIYVNNTNGTLLMYAESEKRLRISEATIIKIKNKVSSCSLK